MITLIYVLWLATMPFWAPDQPLDGLDQLLQLTGMPAHVADYVQDEAYDALHSIGWEGP